VADVTSGNIGPISYKETFNFVIYLLNCVNAKDDFGLPENLAVVIVMTNKIK
jgi:hypothetical protein